MMQALEPRLLMAAHIYSNGPSAISDYNVATNATKFGLVSNLSIIADIEATSGYLYVLETGGSQNRVGVYTTAGAPVTEAFIDLASFPLGRDLDYSDGKLYVTYVQGYDPGVAVFNATTGDLLFNWLFDKDGLNPDSIMGIDVVGGQIYAITRGGSSISHYLENGGVVNRDLITGLDYATGIEVSGGNIYLTINPDHPQNDRIAKYTTSGALVNAALVTSTSELGEIKIQGSDLYVRLGANQIHRYSISGAPIKGPIAFGRQVAVADVSDVPGQRYFDEAYYLATNPSVKQAVAAGVYASGWSHFASIGQFQSRMPYPGFSEVNYLWTNPDVARAVNAGVFKTGFQHFATLGANEGRLGSGVAVPAPVSGEPQTFFNAGYYLNANPDVAAAVAAGKITSAWVHFQRHGQFEGRSPSNLYNEKAYLAAHPDVAAAVNAKGFPNGFWHFVQFGFAEGRTM